jgi:hypothetical protein
VCASKGRPTYFVNERATVERYLGRQGRIRSGVVRFALLDEIVLSRQGEGQAGEDRQEQRGTHGRLEGSGLVLIRARE